MNIATPRGIRLVDRIPPWLMSITNEMQIHKTVNHRIREIIWITENRRTLSVLAPHASHAYIIEKEAVD